MPKDNYELEIKKKRRYRYVLEKDFNNTYPAINNP